MSNLILNINSNRPTNYLQNTFETPGGSREIANRIVNFVVSTLSGCESANATSSTPPSIAVSIQQNAAQATGSLTFSAISTANDTFLINGVTMTAVSSGATGNQWNVGSTATDQATKFAAVVNASATSLISGQVTASAALGVVTFTSKHSSVSGNQTTIAKGTDAGSVMSVSGARLTGGTNDPNAQTLSF